nr:hypothetical protein [Tanacetum cinerariifolium]
MENHPHEAINTVLNCVIPYIQNGDDRNSVSLVCRKLCELEDLELLARTCGRDLRVLKIRKCKGFSTDGLLHIGTYCNDLRTLCLKGNQFNNKDGKWLHELALQNTGIESLDFRYFHLYDVKDLTLLAKNCCRSLVSLKIAAVVDLINLVDVFRHVVRLEDFVGSEWVEDHVYAGFNFLQLRELHLIDVYLDDNSQCLLIKSCPNLEVLYTTTVFGDMGLQVIGRSCKKLLKFKTYGWATQMGLITMAKGCLDLECLYINNLTNMPINNPINNLTDISNENFDFIGTHMKNLRDFHMTAKYPPSTWTWRINRCLFEYIGKYGHNLRYLSLGHLGESAAAGLMSANVTRGHDDDRGGDDRPTSDQTQFDLKPHMEFERWSKIYTDWDAQIAFRNDPKNLARCAQNRKTGQRARSYAGRDPSHLLPLEIRSIDAVMALNNAQTKTNSSAFRSMLEKHQLTRPNFNEWFRALKLVVRTEKLQDVFETALPPAPAAGADAQALADWAVLFDRYNEVACLMLGTMPPNSISNLKITLLWRWLLSSKKCMENLQLLNSKSW